MIRGWLPRRPVAMDRVSSCTWSGGSSGVRRTKTKDHDIDADNHRLAVHVPSASQHLAIHASSSIQRSCTRPPPTSAAGNPGSPSLPSHRPSPSHCTGTYTQSPTTHHRRRRRERGREPYKEIGKNCEIPPSTMMTATARLTIRLHPAQQCQHPSASSIDIAAQQPSTRLWGAGGGGDIQAVREIHLVLRRDVRCVVSSRIKGWTRWMRRREVSK